MGILSNRYLHIALFAAVFYFIGAKWPGIAKSTGLA